VSVLAQGQTRLTNAVPPLSRRHRWGDPALVGLVALAVYALHGTRGPLSRDLGVFTYGGEHVAKGVPPYLGIFNSVGPLADAIPGAAIWVGNLVGADPVLAARRAYILIAAACCAMLCVLAREVFISRAAGFLAPAVLLTFRDFTVLASSGPREKTPMVLFVLVALALLLRHRWLAAGVFAALATLTWQPALLVLLTAFAASLLTSGVRRREARDAVVAFLAGGAIPSVLVVGFYLVHGGLGIAVDGFLVISFYTTQPGAISEPVLTWVTLFRDYQQSLFVVLAGLVALLTIAVRAGLGLRRGPTQDLDPVARRLVVVGAAALVGTVWTVAVINGGPDLFELLPFAAMGVTGLVLLLAARLSRRLAVTLVGAAVAVALVSATAESVTTRSHELARQRRDVNAVLATQPRSAQVLSIDAPEVLALSQRDNPTILQLFSLNEDNFLEHRLAGGLSGYAADVRRLQPTFVVVGGGLHRSTWADQMLAQDYSVVGRGTLWTWYLNRDAGQKALAAARRANSSAMRGYTPPAR
jgi:hypothetical protein